MLKFIDKLIIRYQKKLIAELRKDLLQKDINKVINKYV